jgi:hypothetical protein
MGWAMRVLSAPRWLAIAIGFTLGSFTAVGQTLPAPGSQSPPNIEGAKIAYTIDRGMPYSGIWITKHVTTFPDGEVKRDRNTRKVWRDSDGRTRKDVTWTRPTGVVATVCRIEDPVAKVRYIWRIEQGRKTIVTGTHFTMDKYAVTEIWADPSLRPVETPPGVSVIILGPARRMNPNPNEQKLGPTYMNGVYAEGVRTIEPIQSDPTRHRIEETWSAPDLNLFIKSYLDDGNGFIEDSELKNIDRSEPDPSVFLPPSSLPKRQAPESDPAWREGYGAD